MRNETIPCPRCGRQGVLEDAATIWCVVCGSRPTPAEQDRIARNIEAAERERDGRYRVRLGTYR